MYIVYCTCFASTTKFRNGQWITQLTIFHPRSRWKRPGKRKEGNDVWKESLPYLYCCLMPVEFLATQNYSGSFDAIYNCFGWASIRKSTPLMIMRLERQDSCLASALWPPCRRLSTDFFFIDSQLYKKKKKWSDSKKENVRHEFIK